MKFYSFIFVYGLVAAAANVFGGLIIVQRDWRRDYLKYFVALGAGYMLAVATLEMIPESMSRLRMAPVLILAGYLLVHFFEHTLTPHFHFGEETHPHEVRSHTVGYSSLLGLIIHTFFDGVSIASGFLISHPLGLLIFIAVLLHKLPEGFTVASVMMAAGRSRRMALWAAVSLGVSTMLGILSMSLNKSLVHFGLPLTAGVALYVAASDLMPEVNKEPGFKVAAVVFAGVVFFSLTKLLLQGSI
ncbi:MAG: ZIP family metal transporter [Acidobacteriia bacterium]|nr:ZIP family metal transporter [Terriglobia bacterium]